MAEASSSESRRISETSWITPTLPRSSPPTSSGAAFTTTSFWFGPTWSLAPRMGLRVRSTRRCTLSPCRMSTVTGRWRTASSESPMSFE